MQDESYIVIQGWMTKLDIKGNELMVFAIIHGFTQDGKHWYHGTRGYLAEWCGCSKGTVDNALRSLAEKGLIERREVEADGFTRVEYRTATTIKNCEGGQNFDRGGAQNLGGGVPNFGSINNLEDISKDIDIKHKGGSSKFRPPSVEEVRAYVTEKGYAIDPESFVAYYEARGWKMGKTPMKSWKAACTTWHRRSGQSHVAAQSRVASRGTAQDESSFAGIPSLDDLMGA